MKNLKRILYILIATSIMFSCERINPKTHVMDIDMRIAAINYESNLTNDKFRTPQLCNTILFETIEGEKLYREINTCKMYGLDMNINSKWIYNHRVGDIVHFDYLLKSEFFTIKER